MLWLQGVKTTSRQCLSFTSSKLFLTLAALLFSGAMSNANAGNNSGPSAQNSSGTNAQLDCEKAYTSPDSLWPANHKYKSIEIKGIEGLNNNEHLTTTVHCIRQDEPLNGNGDGNTDIDGKGIGSNKAQVRAERKGGGNGRVYHIGFNAVGSAGGSCAGVVTVGVPPSKNKSIIDDGPLYGSNPTHADCALIEPINTAPEITSTPIITTTADASYTYEVIATDAENDTLTYQLTSPP